MIRRKSATGKHWSITVWQWNRIRHYNIFLHFYSNVENEGYPHTSAKKTEVWGRNGKSQLKLTVKLCTNPKTCISEVKKRPRQVGQV
jgi:hypothetical protein